MPTEVTCGHWCRVGSLPGIKPMNPPPTDDLQAHVIRLPSLALKKFLNDRLDVLDSRIDGLLPGHHRHQIAVRPDGSFMSRPRQKIPVSLLEDPGEQTNSTFGSTSPPSASLASARYL